MIHSFIHSGHFYSAPSSPLLLRGAPDYNTDTVSKFHAEAHLQLQIKDLPKVPTWRQQRKSTARVIDLTDAPPGPKSNIQLIRLCHSSLIISFIHFLIHSLIHL